MSGPVWSDLQEARRHSVLPVNRTMLGCLGLFHSNVFRQVQVQFLPASVRALNRACYVKKAKQIALNRSFKCDHRALSPNDRRIFVFYCYIFKGHIVFFKENYMALYGFALVQKFLILFLVLSDK